MIKVSVMYPHTEDARFDLEYYRNTHMPLIASKLGDALKGSGVEKGISGGAPGQAPTYTCVGYLLFDSVESFSAAFAPAGRDIMKDVPNFTDIRSILQISEIVD